MFFILIETFFCNQTIKSIQISFGASDLVMWALHAETHHSMRQNALLVVPKLYLLKFDAFAAIGLVTW